MCGILAIFSSSLDPTTLRKVLISSSSELRHRGPDWSGYIVIDKNVNFADDPTANNNTGGISIPLAHGIAHERLAIMDPESGSQPLVSTDGNIIVAANGEVYNYKEIYNSQLAKEYVPMTGSDCEVILPLWARYNDINNNDSNSNDLASLPNVLRGMFSIIIYDKTTDTYFVFRDHVGKTPLYIGWGDDGSTWVSSEMKGLIGRCNKFQNFPPGHYYSNKGRRAGEFVRWYRPAWAPEMASGLNVPIPKGRFQAASIYIFEYMVQVDFFTLHLSPFIILFICIYHQHSGRFTQCLRKGRNASDDVGCALGRPALGRARFESRGGHLSAQRHAQIEKFPQVAFLHHRVGEQSGPRGRETRGRLFGHDASCLYLHARGGRRCHPRCDT